MKLDQLTDFLDRHRCPYKPIKERKDINLCGGKMGYTNLPMNESSIHFLNIIYHSFDGLHDFSRKEITPSGGLSIAGVNTLFAYYWIKNIERGFLDKTIVAFDLFVYVNFRLYGFTCGSARAEIKKTGGIAMQKLLTCAKAVNFDLTKYRAKDGIAVKKTIAHPLIACLYPILPLEFGSINQVCHLDLNESYRSRIAEAIPDFKVLFDEVDKEFPDHKENKDIINMSIGMFQSERYMGANYANISKIAIDGTRKKIEEISDDLRKAGYLILGYNTDGIWYRSASSETPMVYHGKGEGNKPGGWKNDFIDCNFVPLSAGGNWCVLKGKHYGKEGFWKALRGNYSYAEVKKYEDWECWEDIVKAMSSAEVAIINFDKLKGWSLKRQKLYLDDYKLPVVKDATLKVLRNKETLKYEEINAELEEE